jgi:Tfp pilus assembly protein PilO
MKELLIKNIHWLLIFYAANNIFMLYEEKSEQFENIIAQTPVLSAKIQKEKRKLVQIEEFKKNLSATKKRVTEVVKQIEKVQKQLPSDVNDAEVQKLLSDIGSKLRVQDEQQAPKNETNNGFYFAKEYEYKARGTFIQSLIFFENLEKAERILNVKSFQINRIQENVRSRFQIVDFKIVIESFRYNKNYRERDAVKEIENQFN